MDEKALSQVYSGRRPDGTSYTVMIVDDSAFIIKLIQRIVATVGYNVVATAADGREAVERYREHRPDVVTMDVTMPNMNGIQAIEEILKVDPKAKIVVASSIGHEEIVKTAISKGAKHYIVKPIQMERTLRVLRSVLEKQ